MPEKLFKPTDVVEVASIYLGQSLDLHKLRQSKSLATAPLAIRAGEKGVAILFRYGAVILFGLQPLEITKFISEIQDLVVQPFDNPEREDFEIFIDEKINEGGEVGGICLHAYNIERLQIVADVLAKSIVLSHYELDLTEQFDRIEPLADSLRRGRYGGTKGRDLLQHIGDTLMIEAKMIGRIEVSEKPELIWDYPQYDRLYLRLEDEFSLTERHSAIDRKLGLISRTAQTLLDLIHSERSLRVEWYIVILIVIDILVAFVEKVI